VARIKIKDLPRDKKITKEEMKRILGGISSEPVYFTPGIFQPQLSAISIKYGLNKY
jgi:hypothetical protein